MKKLLTRVWRVLFHKHNIIVTSRKLIGREKEVSDMDIETINVYLCKGYCICCKEKLMWKQHIHPIFDTKQPYDKE